MSGSSVSGQVEESKAVGVTGKKDSDHNPEAEKLPYGFSKIQHKEETKDFSKLLKLEKTIGTFGEDLKDDDEIVDEATAQQIKELADSEDLQQLQYEIDQSRNQNDVRVAVIGNVDSGKSTLVGVLTKSQLDDGRGLARSKVFNFSHEQVNGRTSSIGQEIMGFDSKLQQVVYDRDNATRNQSWGHVVSNSDKLVTFLDLCGHEKYLKTTMFGLVGLMPDYSMIVVGANMGVSRMTREHLGISLALGIPVFIVVTKVDIAPKQVFDETIATLTKIMESKQAGKQVNIITDKSDMQMAAKAMPSNQTCPIFSVSNVSGEGLDKLKEFLGLISSRVSISGQFGLPTDPVEFFIDGNYQVKGVGTVVTGTLLSGTVKPGQVLQLGPTKVGGFTLV